jgi:5-methyltetrahydrofolate--homocysteine methyltransferase
MSALLTTTMREMKTTLEAIQEAGLRKQVKVMIGGAPVTDRFAKEIGADGYAPDAATAVDITKSLTR